MPPAPTLAEIGFSPSVEWRGTNGGATAGFMAAMATDLTAHMPHAAGGGIAASSPAAATSPLAQFARGGDLAPTEGWVTQPVLLQVIDAGDVSLPLRDRIAATADCFTAAGPAQLQAGGSGGSRPTSIRRLLKLVVTDGVLPSSLTLIEARPIAALTGVCCGTKLTINRWKIRGGAIVLDKAAPVAVHPAAPVVLPRQRAAQLRSWHLDRALNGRAPNNPDGGGDAPQQPAIGAGASAAPRIAAPPKQPVPAPQALPVAAPAAHRAAHAPAAPAPAAADIGGGLGGLGDSGSRFVSSRPAPKRTPFLPRSGNQQPEGAVPPLAVPEPAGQQQQQAASTTMPPPPAGPAPRPGGSIPVPRRPSAHLRDTLNGQSARFAGIVVQVAYPLFVRDGHPVLPVVISDGSFATLVDMGSHWLCKQLGLSPEEAAACRNDPARREEWKARSNAAGIVLQNLGKCSFIVAPPPGFDPTVPHPSPEEFTQTLAAQVELRVTAKLPTLVSVTEDYGASAQAASRLANGARAPLA